jgi:hypothetical protein
MRSRARWAAAAASIALIGGTVAVSAAPVAAAPAPIRILSVSAENVKAGDKVRVRFRVTNTGGGTETAIVVVGGGLPCTTGCRAEPALGAGQSRDFAATLVAPAAAPGEITGLNISVAVRLGGQNSFDFTMVYVHGPGTSPGGAEQPSSDVDRVAGRVRDSDGKTITGVALTIRDSAGHEYRATSDRNGRFSIRSSAAEPIAEGAITVAASRGGYRTTRTTVQGRAGGTASVQMTLTAAAAPAKSSPSAPSPLAAAETPDPKVSVAAAPPAYEPVSDEDGNPVLFVLGGLLVAVGVGALALLVVRRRKTLDTPAPLVPATTQLMAPGRAGMADTPTAVLPVQGRPGRYGPPPQGGIR